MLCPSQRAAAADDHRNIVERTDPTRSLCLGYSTGHGSAAGTSFPKDYLPRQYRNGEKKQQLMDAWFVGHTATGQGASNFQLHRLLLLMMLMHKTDVI